MGRKEGAWGWTSWELEGASAPAMNKSYNAEPHFPDL